MTGRIAMPAVLVLLCLASLSLGAGRMGLPALLAMEPQAWLTLTASRLPRLVAVVLVGAGLAVCGVILQQVVRNRFVEPATSGGLEAAKLGILVALTVLPDQGQGMRMAAAVAFCLIASLIHVGIVVRMQFRNVVLVPVVGLMYGAVLGALAEFWAYGHNMLQGMQGWMLGDFSKIVQGRYEAVWLILPVVGLAYVFAHRLTVMGMGEEMARGLGLGWRGMVMASLLVVSVTVAATVVTVGAIPFVGLVVPNLVALWKGDNLVRTLPFVAGGGAGLLLVCDIVGRLVIRPYEVPVGLMAGGIGGVIFLLLILQRAR